MPKPNHERAFEAPTYPDEYLDFWARVYLDNPHLRARGVLFSTFLVAPEVLLLACAAPRPAVLASSKSIADGVARRHAGLMAEARTSARELARFESADGHCENGRLVEKLRHRFFPRRRAKRVLVDAN